MIICYLLCCNKSLNTCTQKLKSMVSKVSSIWLSKLSLHMTLTTKAPSTARSFRFHWRDKEMLSEVLECHSPVTQDAQRSKLINPVRAHMNGRKPDPESRNESTSSWISLEVPELSFFMNRHSFPYPILKVPREKSKGSHLTILSAFGLFMFT